MALSKRYYSVNGEMLYEKGVSRVDYLPDALGSVTATTTPGSPSTVENTYRMKPYGSTLVKTGAGADPRFRWLGAAGYRRTNLFRPGVYVRARHYSQEDGRWTTVDPLWPTQPRYSYGKESPTVYSDFWGLLPSQSAEGYLPPNPLPGVKTKNCTREQEIEISKLCTKIAGLSEYQREQIALCIQKTASKIGRSCQGLTPTRLSCLQDFCKNGTVECKVPLPNGNAGKAPGSPLGEEPLVGSRRCLLSGRTGLGVIPPKSEVENMLVVLIHEMAHTCGVRHEGTGHHGDPVFFMQPDKQCNDIFACCVNEVLNNGNDGSPCWIKIKPPVRSRFG